MTATATWTPGVTDATHSAPTSQNIAVLVNGNEVDSASLSGTAASFQIPANITLSPGDTIEVDVYEVNTAGTVGPLKITGTVPPPTPPPTMPPNMATGGQLTFS